MNIKNWLRSEFYIITALMTFTVFISNDTFLPAMEPIANFFGTSIATVNLSMSAFIFGICAPQIPIGKISDKIGRRPVILAGGVIFFLATFAISRIPNIEFFMICRFFQGVGSACILCCAAAMINEHYQYKKRIFALSTVSQLSMMAPMMGPLIGTYILLISNDQWQYIYVYNNYFFVIPLVLAFLFVPETLKSKIKINEEKARKKKAKKDLKNGIEVSIEHIDASKDETIEKESIWQILKTKSYLYLILSISARSVMTIIWVSGSARTIMFDMGYSKEIYSYSQIPVFLSLFLGNALVSKIGHTMLPSKYIKYHISISVPILIILFLIAMYDYNIYTVTILLCGALFAMGSLLPVKESVLYTPFKAKGLAVGVAIVIRSGIDVIGSALPALLFDYSSRVLIYIIITMLLVSATFGLLSIPHVKQIERNLNE